MKTRLACPADAARISALLMANTGDQGGMLLGDWPVEAIKARLAIARAASGQGVLPKIYAMLRATFSRREAILFIKDDNVRSLQAHLHLGMREVARDRFGGQGFVVLSDAPAHSRR